MSTLKIKQGNTVRSTITWTAEDIIAITSAECVVRKADSTEVTYPGTSGGTNRFFVDIPVTPSAPSGRWDIKWQSTDIDYLATEEDFFEVEALVVP